MVVDEVKHLSSNHLYSVQAHLLEEFQDVAKLGSLSLVLRLV